MAEYEAGDPEMDTPVNPYSLLEAVNRSSDTAHTGWLIFLGVMAYLLIAVAGVTHQDLLLEKPVQLPIFGIEIPQIQFFQFAPILLVLFHIGIVSQLVLLARKTLEFDLAVQQLESGVRRTHPLRLELHNFFFVQGIAGSHRSLIIGAFLHAMSWLTLVAIPVLLLLFIQIKFLPYHDVTVTWAHRIALLTDIAMMILLGVFLIRPEPSFFRAVMRTVAYYPLSLMVTVGVFLAVPMFSLFVATVPGEQLDRLTQRMRSNASGDFSRSDSGFVMGFALPSFLGRSDGSLFGLFHRNLIVTDLDLVVNKDVTVGEPTLNLRNRDLRFAKLDRSDLHQADLTGANLDGASLVGTDLRDIRLQCADITLLILTDDREAAQCATARNANFSRAMMTRGQFAGSDFRGAKFEEAQLGQANLSYALISGANFSSANLQKANLTGGIQAQGANFLIAALEGADLTGAQLQFADFSSASMQGVLLAHAHLQSAVLRDSIMSGVDLQRAKLQGSDLTGTQLMGADLRWAEVWMTDLPPKTNLDQADLSDVSLSPLTQVNVTALSRTLSSIDDLRLRALVREALRPIMVAETSKVWGENAASLEWKTMIEEQTVPLGSLDYRIRLSEMLGRLACRNKWPDGAVATGIAKRLLGQNFRGDRETLARAMMAQTCTPAQSIDPALLKQVSGLVTN